jgi:hypothetical protein
LIEELAIGLSSVLKENARVYWVRKRKAASFDVANYTFSIAFLERPG